MTVFNKFLEGIDDRSKRERMEQIFTWIRHHYPHLKQEIKWNQPMYTEHGTFIIGFSVAKKHIAVAPENVAINQFENEIKKTGYDYTKELIRIKWDQPVEYSLLDQLIEFNLKDKANCTTFWRK